MLGEGDINSSTAKKVLKEVISSNADPRKYVTENGLMQINDDDILKKAASDAISENPKWFPITLLENPLLSSLLWVSVCRKPRKRKPGKTYRFS